MVKGRGTNFVPQDLYPTPQPAGAARYAEAGYGDLLGITKPNPVPQWQRFFQAAHAHGTPIHLTRGSRDALVTKAMLGFTAVVATGVLYGLASMSLNKNRIK